MLYLHGLTDFGKVCGHIQAETHMICLLFAQPELTQPGSTGNATWPH